MEPVIPCSVFFFFSSASEQNFDIRPFFSIAFMLLVQVENPQLVIAFLILCYDLEEVMHMKKQFDPVPE